MKLFYLLFLIGLSVSVNAQSYFYTDLDKLLRLSKTNREAQIERRAAEIFHELLNEHRVSRRLDRIEWSELHWIAAINHNNWMMVNNQLSHHQNSGSKNFNGKSPWDRVLFVNTKELPCNYTGENCLYNWASATGTIEEAAKRIADKCFDQWKNSPPHYRNMLSASHSGHGVAFKIAANGQVWGTDLFGNCSGGQYKQSDALLAQEVRLEADGVKENELIVTNDKSAENRVVRLSSANIQNYLLKQMNNTMAEKNLKEHRILRKAAVAHAKYLGTNTKETGTEQVKGRTNFYGASVAQRTGKASLGVWQLTGKAKKVKEAIAIVDTRNSRMSIPEMEALIDRQLARQLDGVNFTSYGVGVIVRKFRDRYYIVVVKKVV
jgi:uncharacterized protein YkwD